MHFLSRTFAIPSSISLIFLKSTQFAASQLFLLNILFGLSLSGLFFSNLSEVFTFADKNSALFLLFPLFWLRVQVARMDRCAMGEVDVMPSVERCRSWWALGRLKKFFDSFGRGLFGIFWQNNHRFRADWSGSIYFATIYHKFATILKPSVRNRWAAANLLLNVLETYATKSGIT